MTIKEVLALKDGTRVILTQIGDEWGDDQGVTGVCVKIGHRLVEADVDRPTDDGIWYPYYAIEELKDAGWECFVALED